jgi:hypothetical protein
MHMRFKINEKAIEQMVEPQWRSQIPFTIHQSIKKTMFAQRVEQQKAMDKHIEGGPVRFTRTGVLYKAGNKRNLHGFVYYEEKRAPYMSLIIDSGIDKAQKVKLNAPVKVRKTKQGNIPNSYIRKKEGDKKFFFGIPKGKSGEKYRGVWRRYGRTGYTKAGKPRGKIRLMVSWEKGQRFQRQTFPARDVFTNHVPRYFERQLPIQLRRAIRSSIARASSQTGF